MHRTGKRQHLYGCTLLLAWTFFGSHHTIFLLFKCARLMGYNVPIDAEPMEDAATENKKMPNGVVEVVVPDKERDA